MPKREQDIARAIVTWWRVLERHQLLVDDITRLRTRLIGAGLVTPSCMIPTPSESVVVAALIQDGKVAPACLIAELDLVVTEAMNTFRQLYTGLFDKQFTPNLLPQQVAFALEWALRSGNWDTGAAALLMARIGAPQTAPRAVHASVWKGRWIDRYAERYPTTIYTRLYAPHACLELAEKVLRDVRLANGETRQGAEWPEDDRYVQAGDALVITLTMGPGADWDDVEDAARRAYKLIPKSGTPENPPRAGKRPYKPQFECLMDAYCEYSEWCKSHKPNHDAFARRRRKPMTGVPLQGDLQLSKRERAERDRVIEALQWLRRENVRSKK